MKVLSLWVVYVHLCMFGLDANAQSKFDNNILKQAVPGPDGYRQRYKDERFEGLYARNVNGEVLEIVSFTYGPVEYELQHNEKLKIKAPTIKKCKEIGVVGASFNLEKNYHLNLLLHPGESKSVPAGEVINHNFIYSTNLGIYGYLGNTPDQYLYLPVYVNSGIIDNSVAAPQIMVVCNHDLMQVRWKYAVTADRICSSYTEPILVTNNLPVFRKYAPIIISLADLERDHEICITIETKAVGEDSWVPKNFKVFIP